MVDGQRMKLEASITHLFSNNLYTIKGNYNFAIQRMEDTTMKRLWKIKKDSEAVSPVIATILMVAITVVLAAVLLVLVLNIGDDTVTPAGNVSYDSAGWGNITVTFLSTTVPATDLEWDGDIDDEGEWDSNTVRTGSVYTLQDGGPVTPGTYNLVYKPTGIAIDSVVVTAPELA